MPLPDGGPWPPPQFAAPFHYMTRCGAWYSGDPDQLAAVYGGGQPSDRPSQYRGGVVGAVARWFWGQPTPPGEKRSKLHVPLAEDIASTSADLLFSEPPTLIVDDTATQARLNEYIEYGLHTTLLEGAEVGAAFGGRYLRVTVDPEVVPDRPFLSVVHADAAVPEFSYGHLRAVTFWQVLERDGGRVLRHLERHEPGAVLHGLYAGDQQDLGRRIALTDHPATRAIAARLTDGDMYLTQVDTLTAVYVPNVRPNRLWRDHKDTAALGRSDYTPGVMSLMDALDETFSSWMRDLRLGKGRIIVPDSYLHNQGPGKGAVFDPEREAYETLHILPGNGTEPAKITATQFAIRVDEHSRTATELLGRIIAGAGYSGQTFGLSGEVAITATEVHARERRSFITRDRKSRYETAALRGILETLLAVDRTVFGTPVVPQPPKIEFADVVAEDTRHRAETIDLLNRAEAVSTETKVRLANPQWDDQQVTEEVAAILAESGRTVTNPDDLGAVGVEIDDPTELDLAQPFGLSSFDAR